MTVADHGNIKDNDSVVCQEHKTPPVKVLSGHSALVQHTTQENYREFELQSPRVQLIKDLTLALFSEATYVHCSHRTRLWKTFIVFLPNEPLKDIKMLVVL